MLFMVVRALGVYPLLFLNSRARQHHHCSSSLAHHPDDAMAVFQSRLRCFYCAARTEIIKSGAVREFCCRNCEAMNYLDEVRISYLSHYYFYLAQLTEPIRMVILQTRQSR